MNFIFLQLDDEGKVVSTIDDETAVQFKAPRTRQATAKEAVLSGDQSQVDEPQPGGSGVSSKRRRASAAAAVPSAAQVDKPKRSREPSQKRRKAGPLLQDDEEDDDEDSDKSEDDNDNIDEIAEKLGRTHNKNRTWSKQIPANFGGQVPAFQPQPSPGVPPDCKTPLDYFKLFVDDRFVENMAAHSQVYAVKKYNCPEAQKVLTPNMIRTSQAIMFMTGYLTPSNRAMYWEVREDTGNSFVKKAMSRDTFKKVIRFTYFVDRDKPDENDRFWKVRPLFDQLNETAKKYVKPTEMVSVDEAMVKYFGPHPLKQYIRGKPTPFGYKVWVMATSAGQLLACQPYAGAKTMLPDYGLGMGPNVVYGLAKQFGLQPGTKAVCDNLFTSVDLCDHLGEMQIGVVGTIRQNRCHGMPLPSKKEFEKKAARGDHNVAYSREICVVQWKDSKAVYLASNCFSPEPLGAVSRYHKSEKVYKNVPIPRLVLLYNTHMGGVDLLDNGAKTYAITTRVKKWYWAIYTWFLCVSMVQAWRLYRLHKREQFMLDRDKENTEQEAWEESVVDQPKRVVEQQREARAQEKKVVEKERKKLEDMPLLEFVRQTVELMVVAHSHTFSNPPWQTQAKARLAPMNLQAVRFDNGRHLIFKSDVHGVCKACKKRTVYRCERCEVALHPDCFYGFHNREESSD